MGGRGSKKCSQRDKGGAVGSPETDPEFVRMKNTRCLAFNCDQLHLCNCKVGTGLICQEKLVGLDHSKFRLTGDKNSKIFKLFNLSKHIYCVWCADFFWCIFKNSQIHCQTFILFISYILKIFMIIHIVKGTVYSSTSC